MTTTAIEATQAIANGDLTRRVDASGKDEVGVLLRAQQNMQASLVRIVRDVPGVAETIRHTSVDIAHCNRDLTARTEDAAHNLQGTAASLPQLMDWVQATPDAAAQASMDAIAHSSEKINDIIEQNAAMVEESSAVTRNLRQQVERLTELVAVFRTS